MQPRREQSERAETYLRLLVESALRSAALRSAGARSAARPPGGMREAVNRVRGAADTLVEAGVLDDETVAQITLTLVMAMQARGLSDGVPVRLRGALPRRSAGKSGPWRVIPTAPNPAGQAGAMPGSRLMALVITADRMIAPGMLRFPPSAGLSELAVPAFADLVATDDLGNGYALTFTDGNWAGSTWSGTIMLRPAPPAGARVLTINSRNGPVLRAELTAPRQASGGQAAARAAGPPADAAIEPVADSPGERLLIRRAEALLGVLSPPSGEVPPSASVQRAMTRAAQVALAIPASLGGVAARARPPGPDEPSLAELVSTLEGAGVLSPLSPVPARLTTLGQMLGVPGVPAPAPSRAAGDPGAKIPARWGAVLSYYGRRSHPAPPPGIGAIGAELPELDGVRFAIAGLRTGWHGTLLYVVARGLPLTMHIHLPELGGGGAFSWWVRDEAGGWHLGIVRDRHPADEDTTLRLALLPPLSPGGAELAVEVTGVTERVTARVRVHW